MLLTKQPAISNPYLDVGLAAVAAADRVIAQYFHQTLTIEHKSNRSPVTVADREAEQIIKKTILKTYPESGFIGEEEGRSKSNSSLTWIIDPIDGTRSYVRGLPWFGTLLALIKDNQLVLGISYLPQLASLAYAVKNEGAFLNHQPINLSVVSTVDTSYIATANFKYFAQAGVADNLIRLSLSASFLRSLPEIYGWHLFFQGKFDAQIEAKGKVWDLAAHAVITAEAGGTVTDLSGQQYTAESANILASNSFLHPKILQYFRKQ